MTQQFWLLKSCELFEQLPAAALERLEQLSQKKSFARKELIYLPSDAADSIFVVTEGRVRIYHINPDGKEAVLGFINQGELFGELAALEATDRNEYAEAMEKTTLVKVPSEGLQQAMETSAQFTLGITKLIGLRRRRIEQRLKSMLFRSNRDRLVHLLLELAEQYGRVHPEGLALGIKLSHQELASIIGSTRETVTVVLNEMQEEGLLTIKRRQVILKKLVRMAESIEQPVPKLPISSASAELLLRKT